MKKIFFITLISVVLIFLVSWPLFFKVNVSCLSQYGPCSGAILKSIGSVNGKSLFSAKNTIEKTLKANFLVAGYSLQFKLPDTLLVNIIEKKPEFALVNQDSNAFDLVDGDGEVLSRDTGTALPLVYTTGNLPKPGESVGETNLFALKLIGGVFEMYQVGTGEIQNDTFVVDLPGQIRVFFPLTGDTQVLLGSLKLIYTKVEGDLAGKFSQIDLRFKNPVLR